MITRPQSHRHCLYVAHGLLGSARAGVRDHPLSRSRRSCWRGGERQQQRRNDELHRWIYDRRTNRGPAPTNSLSPLADRIRRDPLSARSPSRRVGARRPVEGFSLDLTPCTMDSYASDSDSGSYRGSHCLRGRFRSYSATADRGQPRLGRSAAHPTRQYGHRRAGDERDVRDRRVSNAVGNRSIRRSLAGSLGQRADTGPSFLGATAATGRVVKREPLLISAHALTSGVIVRAGLWVNGRQVISPFSTGNEQRLVFQYLLNPRRGWNTVAVFCATKAGAAAAAWSFASR